MKRRSGVASMTGSPVLIGALTVLVLVVAVFLAYNANQGLPFVPTYKLTVQLPNAANLVPGNEVRIGGFRVGAVDGLTAKRLPDGRSYALAHLKLDTSVRPLPVDSTVVVRSRSALGLKYVEIDRGTASAGYADGDTVPLSQATPQPVEFDQVLNTFNLRTRVGARASIFGIGNGLAGRGIDLNEAIDLLPPLFGNLLPVATNLSAGPTHLNRLFPALGRAAAIVAPVAQAQASLFVNLDTTFSALAVVARPFIQETITQTPPTLAAGIVDFPQIRPFLENTAAFASELRPGVAVLPSTAPQLAQALQFGQPALARAPAFNRRLEGVFQAVERFATDPLVPRGVSRLNDTVVSLKPTLAFLTPVQTKCNYVTLWFRNIGSLLSEGDRNGTWQRFIIVATPQGPNSESGPSSAPANGPTENNHLHSNPYPYTASPGQPQECMAGNETYFAGKTVLGNPPGNAGLVTDGQTGQTP